METTLFYDGKWHAPLNNNWFEVRDPATGDLIGRTALADAADVDRAVAAAKRALPAWAGMPADARAAILHDAANRIEAEGDEIARLLTLEQGKPVPDARKEVDFGLKVLRYYAEEGRRLGGELRPTADLDVKTVVSRQPIGVTAGIVPWNYPVDLYCWKIAPALATGCPIVIKPPHETPFAIARLVDCFHAAGLPAGVLANLPGTGPSAGAALSAHPDIAAISATASVAAGQDIARRAAGNLKRVVLELGGHAPFIVLADADIEAAAAAAVRRSFSNMGQICIAVNRILVDQRVHRRFVDALVALTESIKLGPGSEPGVAYGPTLNAGVISRTREHLDDALSKGGKLVAGGHAPKDAALRGGHFFRPTLIDDAPLDSLPMNAETFGPLTAIRAFSTQNDMLELANGLPFGLAAYLYTNDLERGWALAERLEFGMIGVNVNDTSELQAPFGGWKLSGMGRELGREGLDAYLQTKAIRMRVRRV